MITVKLIDVRPGAAQRVIAIFETPSAPARSDVVWLRGENDSVREAWLVIGTTYVLELGADAVRELRVDVVRI